MGFYDCDGCNSHHAHCNGSGTVSVFEQDGPTSYVCQCHCAVSARRKQADDWAIARFIEKYGVERIKAAIDRITAVAQAPHQAGG